MANWPQEEPEFGQSSMQAEETEGRRQKRGTGKKDISMHWESENKRIDSLESLDRDEMRLQRERRRLTGC